jgi:hypothetical protein
MDEREYWTRQLEETLCELDAAKGRTALNRAAKRLQQARGELKRIEAEQPNRPTTRARGRAFS